MHQDKLQDGKKTDGVTAQLFFWPGQSDLASHLAHQLGGPAPLAFDPMAVTEALRSRITAVVLWRGPDADLAPCLITGDPVAQAMEDWKDRARALAVLFRKNRRLMILAEGEALRSTGTGALAERLALTAAPTLPDLQPPAPLGLALTQLALEQDDDLRQLLEEMVSSSLPVPEAALGDVLTLAVAQSAKAGQTLVALHQDLAASEERRHRAEADLAQAKAREDQLAARLHQTEATMVAEAATLTARLTERDAEAEMLRGQVVVNHSTLIQQSDASLAASQQAAARIKALDDALALQDAKLAEIESQADLLRNQLGLTQSLLTDQTEAAQSAATAATQRISVLEKALAKAEKQAAALLSDTNAVSARLMQRDAEGQALRTQVDQQKSDLAKHEKQAAAMLADARAINARLAERDTEVQAMRAEIGSHKAALTEQASANAAAADATGLRISALEEELAKQEKKSARLMAEGLSVSAKLAQRDTALALMTQQLVSIQNGLAEQVAATADQAQAAALRIQSLQDQAQAQAEARTTAEEEARGLRRSIAAVEQALADERRQQAAVLADRAAEIDLLSRQVHVLQDGLSQIVTTSADHQMAEAKALAAASAEDPAPRTDAWDKALAKALAAARSEAEQRAKLEQDLEAVKTRLHLRIQREADIGFNQKLFTQMSLEATASLDEIARLAAANGASQAS